MQAKTQLQAFLRLATITLLNITAVLCIYGPSFNTDMNKYADPMFQPVEHGIGYDSPAAPTDGIHID